MIQDKNQLGRVVQGPREVISEEKVMVNGKGQYYIGQDIIYIDADGTTTIPLPYTRISKESWAERSKAELAFRMQNFTRYNLS